MAKKIKWHDVCVWDERGEQLTGEARTDVLLKYRKNENMLLIWLCDPNLADSQGKIDGVLIEDLGPSVAEIDWTGIDEIE